MLPYFGIHCGERGWFTVKSFRACLRRASSVHCKYLEYSFRFAIIQVMGHEFGYFFFQAVDLTSHIICPVFDNL